MERSDACLVLAIVRKSPTKAKEVEVSVQSQQERIRARIKQDMAVGVLPQNVGIVWAVDVCKGDDPQRSNLLDALEREEYIRAYCLNVDRFSRSWLGMKWLHEHFTSGLQLHFVEGIADLYDKNGDLIEEQYMFFSIQCIYAQYELLKIRKRTAAGRAKLTPEQWRQKYRGRKKGAKNRRSPLRQAGKAMGKPSRITPDVARSMVLAPGSSSPGAPFS